MKKDILYALACLSFTTMIGGAVYEHLCVVPQWTAAPPLSLSMFQGSFGLKPEVFWKMIHPVTLLLFVLTLVLHWSSDRKRALLTTLGAYLFILVITAIYFVPELLSITNTTFVQEVDANLATRAAAWENWSLLRLAVLFLLAINLFLGLAKPNHLLPDANTTPQRKQSPRSLETA